MESDLLSYKKDLYFDIGLDSEYEGVFAEESFFNLATNNLQQAGIVDDVEACAFRDSRRGIKLDGYCWNPLEGSLCALISVLSEDDSDLTTISKTEIQRAGGRVTKFLEKCVTPAFVSTLDPASGAYTCASYVANLLPDILKIRVMVITDHVLSDRVKAINLENILDVQTSIEIWDLNRFRSLDLSEGETEPFSIGPELLGEHGIAVIKGADLPNGATAFLGVMPAEILSNIYSEYGQRLLEGNVRTFLDFRSVVNRGLRKTLATEPENFFAYNNGITLTADSAETVTSGELTYIKQVTNLQIVNGGQTTSALYFAPKEAGSVNTSNGDILYKNIDLNRVAVQMKLTVFNENNQESIDEYRARISEYANSQNSIQSSDLVSNHPIHLSIERLSRQITMPSSETGLSSKWFYERTRGQYSTKLRALGGAAGNRFKLEFPKAQLFTKTDMAKYVNTWRMRPHIVKKGAQANLKALGPELIEEYQRDPSNFEGGFFRALIAQAILFRNTDKAVLASDWYQEERGLKAEAVTFGISLLRHRLIETNKDLNLERIFNEQSLSISLTAAIIESSRIVRQSISDSAFRGGTGNPSEFCKSETGWKKIKDLKIDLSLLESADLVDGIDKRSAEHEAKAMNKASKSVHDYQQAFDLGADFWDALVRFNRQFYPGNAVQVGVPIRCSQMVQGGKPVTEKQLKAASKIIAEAEEKGFVFAG